MLVAGVVNAIYKKDSIQVRRNLFLVLRKKIKVINNRLHALFLYIATGALYYLVGCVRHMLEIKVYKIIA